mgnify:CR=1 FL=1
MNITTDRSYYSAEGVKHSLGHRGDCCLGETLVAPAGAMIHSGFQVDSMSDQTRYYVDPLCNRQTVPVGYEAHLERKGSPYVAAEWSLVKL